MGFFLTRQAEISDLDFVLVELKKFSDFFKSKHPLFGDDEQYNRQLISNLIEKHLFIIAFHEEHGPVGFICGLVMPHLFNPKIKCLSEVFWWVRPEYRMSRAGYLLLKEFVKYGKENCDWVTMTIEDQSPVNPDSLIRLGFKNKEKSFIMEN